MTKSAAKRAFPLEGFKALNDQVYMRDSGPEPPPPDHPGAVIIYGWGDGLPKHVAKYAAGYVAMYPKSKHFVCISPISKAMFSDINGRGKSFEAILDNLDVHLGVEESDENNGNKTPASSPNSSSPEEETSPTSSPKPTRTPNRSVLVHCMSNTGAIFFSSLLHLYHRRHGRPFPHSLVVLDSTPGSPYLAWDTLKRWSRAMALGLARFFPWPFGLTQSVCGLLLLINYVLSLLKRSKAAGVQALEIVDDERFETRAAKRLYLYSREDELISASDVERFSEASRRKGYQVRREVFKGSDHVDHMRLYPYRYWAVIGEAWKWTLEKDPVEEAGGDGLGG